MKILYVSTISNTINTFMIPHIKMLIENGHQVDVAFNIIQDVNPNISEMGCEIYEIPFQRSPFRKQNITAFKTLSNIVETQKYDLLHVHTPVAAAIARMVCKSKNVKVIYTAHGFHFFTGAPILNWLLYYPVEKYLAKCTDVLITINKEDHERSLTSLNAKQCIYIPGVGIDVEKFEDVNVDRIKQREEMGISADDFIILSVGETNKNKNHETVIRALASMKNDRIHYIICGEGPLMGNLSDLVEQLKVQNQVHLLGFRRNIPEICKIADVFVFPSYREGLSVALMEAMALGMPIICSNIRGNIDLVDVNKGGELVNPKDCKAFAIAIAKLENSEDLCMKYGLYNKEKIKQYSSEHVLAELKQVYQNVIRVL